MNWHFWRPFRRPEPDTCSVIEPLLSLYADKMASPAEVRRVEQHMGICDDCRHALQWMQATHLVISERPVVLPPVDMRARIARAIAASSPSPIPVQIRTVRRPLVMRPAVWAMAASVAVLGVIAEHLTRPQPPAAPRAISVLAPSKSMPAKQPTSVALTPAPVGGRPHVKPHTSLVASRLKPDTQPLSERLPVRTDHSTLGISTRTANAAPAHTPLVYSQNNIAHPAPAKVSGVPFAPKIAFVAPKTDKTLSIVKTDHAPAASLAAVNSGTLPEPGSSVQTPPVIVASAPPAPVVAAHNDVPEPAPSHSANTDLLGSVKIRVASLNGISVQKKVYRDSNARVQVAAYNTGAESGKFVQQPITYTDGFNPKQ